MAAEGPRFVRKIKIAVTASGRFRPALWLRPPKLKVLPSADGLIKRDVFALPSPFPLLQRFAPVPPSSSRFSRVHTSQFPLSTHQGPTAREPLNPYWANEGACWEVEVQEGAWTRVRVHDAGRWKKQGQGFLGEITLADLWILLPQDRAGEVHLARDLEKGAENVAVSGKLVLRVSSDELPRPAPPSTAPSISALPYLVPYRPAATRILSSPYPSTPAPSTAPLCTHPAEPSHAPPIRARHRSPIASAYRYLSQASDVARRPYSHSHPHPSSRPHASCSHLAVADPSFANRLSSALFPTRTSRPQFQPRPTSLAAGRLDLEAAVAASATSVHRRMTLAEHQRGAAVVINVNEALSEGGKVLPGQGKGGSSSGGFAAEEAAEGLSRLTIATVPQSASPSGVHYFGQEGGSGPISTGETDLGPLPEGWEARSAPKGRTAQIQLRPFDFDLDDVASGSASSRKYFVDHNVHETTWDDPRLPSLHPESDQGKRDFRRKLVYFRSQPPLRPPFSGGDVMKYPERELKTRLMITFKGEEGVDFGGVSRYFFFLLSHAIFVASYCLFELTEKASYTLQVNPEHLDYFTFVGRCVGLVIFHRRFLDAHFATSIYKSCWEKKVGLDDIALVDRQLWQSLSWMANNDIAYILDLDFTSQYELFGALETLDLKPNSADGRVEKQLEAFKKGLDGIVPLKESKVFDEKELELLIGSVETIDVGDWQKNTAYRGYQQEDEVVQWFWQAVKTWPAEMKSRLLQFTIGTSRTPVNGFKDLQGSDAPRLFTLEKTGESTQLPKSHTCFNRFDLPPYPNFKTLEQKSAFAVENIMCFGHE
ncbi:hypothetical protein JCM21900_003647 [Sporobolomyces salmonicolor]